MKKFLTLFLMLMLVFVQTSFAIQILQESTLKGNAAKIDFVGPGLTTSGDKVTVDLTDLNQSSPTGDKEVLKVTQSDADHGFLNFVGETGQSKSIDSYTTTNSSKTGTIMIRYTNAVTGLETTGYIDIKSGPN